MEAVLPLKISGDYQNSDLARAKLLLFSLEKFWDPSSDLLVYIVCAQSDMRILQEQLISDRLRTVYINQDDLVPYFKEASPFPASRKQMMIKLIAHELVKGEYYLLLDADIVCTKPFGKKDLLPGGKALVDWEPKVTHPEWWIGSSELLGIPSSLEDLGMGVTPQLFSTRVCRNLRAYLEDVKKEAFQKVLGENPFWTEYSLYSLFAQMTGQMEELHHGADWMQGNSKNLYSSRASFWGLDQYFSWDPSSAFDPLVPGMFIVCQSSTHIPPQYVNEKLAPFLGATVQGLTHNAPQVIDVPRIIYDLYRAIIGTHPDPARMSQYIEVLEKTRDLGLVVRSLSDSERLEGHLSAGR